METHTSHDLGPEGGVVSSDPIAIHTFTTREAYKQSPMHSAVAPTARQRVADVAALNGSTAVGEHNPGRAAQIAVAVVHPPVAGLRTHPYARPLTTRAPVPRQSSYDRPVSSGGGQSNLLQAQLRARIEEAQQRQRDWEHQYNAAMEKEAEEEKQFEDEMSQEDPASVGSTASASTQEMGEMERKFVETLINGTKDKKTGQVKFEGIMRKENLLGQPNHPYTHQRNVVRNIAARKTTAYVVAHDPGLGKTATALMAYCAEACMLDRVPKILISVPSATLDQWQDAVTDWVRINPKKVLVTSKLANVTAHSLLTHDIVILSKDCIGRAYATCFEHYQKHHQIQTGPGLRWVSQWDRKGFQEGPGHMYSLHPLFEPPDDETHGWYGHWDMVVVDEVRFATRTLTHTHTLFTTERRLPFAGPRHAQPRVAPLRVARRARLERDQAHWPYRYAAHQQDGRLWRHCEGHQLAARTH